MLLWNQGGLDGDATCCTITRIHRALQLFETTLLTVGCSNRWLGIGLWLSCGLPESVRVKPFHWSSTWQKDNPRFLPVSLLNHFSQLLQSQIPDFRGWKSHEKSYETKDMGSAQASLLRSSIMKENTLWTQTVQSQKVRRCTWEAKWQRCTDGQLDSMCSCKLVPVYMYLQRCWTNCDHNEANLGSILSFLWQQNTTCYNVDQ